MLPFFPSLNFLCVTNNSTSTSSLRWYKPYSVCVCTVLSFVEFEMAKHHLSQAKHEAKVPPTPAAAAATTAASSFMASATTPGMCGIQKLWFSSGNMIGSSHQLGPLKECILLHTPDVAWRQADRSVCVRMRMQFVQMRDTDQLCYSNVATQSLTVKDWSVKLPFVHDWLEQDTEVREVQGILDRHFLHFIVLTLVFSRCLS